jgi:hypothetical protein
MPTELSSKKKLEQFLTSPLLLGDVYCQPSPAALHGGDETPNAPADSNRKNFLQRQWKQSKLGPWI